MTAPAVIGSCWLCADLPPEKRCGSWGCWSAEAPRMGAVDLKSLRAPRLCVSCESRPALIGDGKNECEVCDPGQSDKYKRDPTEREQAEHEMQEQHFFEHGHRWGAGVVKQGRGARLNDYDGPEEA